MSQEEKKLNVGKDSVVIGNVSGEIGDGSVVIGATDSRGNVILNQSMAIGRNAHAGPGSIAIGANAGAGSELPAILSEIGKLIELNQSQNVKIAFNELCVELGKPTKNPSKIEHLWEVVKIFATMNGSIALADRATAILRQFF